MRIFKTTIVRALRLLTVLALLPTAGVAWSRPAEPNPRYDIRVMVKPDALSVDTNVTLPPVTEPRKSLQFQLLPSMGTPEVRLIAPQAGGALTVRKVKEEGDKLKPRVTWEIDPAVPFPANQPISLHIIHSGGGGGALVHYVGPEFVIASGIVQPWYPQFSKAKMLGSLTVDMPSSFLAVASGEQVSDRLMGDRRVMTFQISKPTQIDLTAGPLKATRVGQKPREIPISLYLLKDHDFAGDLGDLVRRSIHILETEFGPFPVKHFAVVEFPTDPGMKASFSGASVDGYILMRTDDLDTKRADPSASFFGHEIGHQWWGVSVSYTGGGGDFMLDEALAEYGRLKVVEALRGPVEAKAFRDYSRDKALRRIAAGYDGPLFDMPEPTPSQATFLYQDVARSKGALFYDVIGRSIGAARLRRFFHAITSTYAHSSDLTWHAFVARLRQAAGRKDQWVVDQWLNQNGLPVLDLKWTGRDEKMTVEINQQQPGIPPYRLTLPIRIVYADGSADLRELQVAAQAKTSAVLSTSKLVSRVELDPERTLPWVTPDEFASAAAVKNFTLAWQLWNYEGRSAEAEQVLKAALAAHTRVDTSPAEFLERYEYGWILEEAGKLPEALAQYRRALELPGRPQGDDRVHLIQDYVNIARVASKTGDKALSKWAAQGAISLIDAGEQDSYTRRTRPDAEKYLN